MNDKLGLAHFLARGDAVPYTVAIRLLMSVASWYIIIGKACH